MALAFCEIENVRISRLSEEINGRSLPLVDSPFCGRPSPALDWRPDGAPHRGKSSAIDPGFGRLPELRRRSLETGRGSLLRSRAHLDRFAKEAPAYIDHAKGHSSVDERIVDTSLFTSRWTSRDIRE